MTLRSFSKNKRRNITAECLNIRLISVFTKRVLQGFDERDSAVKLRDLPFRFKEINRFGVHADIRPLVRPMFLATAAHKML